ncbi:flippase-like domain-containing protein [Halonotius terrestris]|uniref:Flippase-like domain-containing protein n=1 Tax=Halonotius terrestris TaxID=2487750 RepID=A0A8J8TB98_9EURY|nr:lysylphosphatidylglycerol synthase transmembrane domain-containing protein [Halonotius terrestris]TQQ80960.1 flippase-like domain-containing protein [Halonotius terrestris]
MASDRLRTTLLGFLLAAAVIAALAWLVGVEDVLRTLRTADRAGVAMVAALIFGWVACWGLGMRAALRSYGASVSVWTGLLLSTGAGFANNVTPFGNAGGEPLTTLLVAERTSVAYERGLAAMAAVDAVNIVSSVCFAVLGFVWLAVDGSLDSQLIGAAAIAVVTGVGVALAARSLWRRRRGVTARLTGGLARALAWLESHVPRISTPDRAALARRVEGFVDDLEHIAADRRTLAAVLGYSLAGWLCQLLAFWAAFEAIGEPIPVTTALVAVPLASIALALPLPGGAGGIESALVAILVGTPLASVTPAVAVAGVVLFRGFAYWLPTTLGGLVFAESAVHWLRQSRR